MKKEIKFGDYTEAEIVAIQSDNTILCNLLGSEKVMQAKYDENMQLIGEDEVIRPLRAEGFSCDNGKFFTLTDEELEELKHPKMQESN